MGRGHDEKHRVRPGVLLALGLIAMVVFPATALAVLGDFTEPSTSPEPAGKTSESVATGDFNGDGSADLVVANKDSNDLTVLLNNGKGDFAPAATSPESVTSPWQVIVAHFNEDDDLDLAVSTQTGAEDGAVMVLLGDGKGDFSPASGSPEALTSPTRNLAAGDLDDDGDEDLAVAEFFPAKVAVLLNDGSGSFAPPPSSPEEAGGFATNVTSIVTGDFNGDEAVDIAAGSEFGNEIKIYFNDGEEDGDFTEAAAKTGIDGTSMTIGFFDAGDEPDLAIGEGGKKFATILLGNGAGFTAAPTSPEELPNEARSIATADFNNDGKADLAATGGNTPGFVAVLLGNGAGDFTAAASSPESVGSVPISIAAAPLNDDASVDLAVANIFTEKVNILFNDFAPVTEPPTENPPPPPPTTGPDPALVPNTKLGIRPGAKVRTKKAKIKVKFTFSSDVAGATFQCKLDKGAYKPCASPKTYKVNPGKHKFSVRAVAPGGTDATPATSTFKVIKQKG